MDFEPFLIPPARALLTQNQSVAYPEPEREQILRAYAERSSAARTVPHLRRLAQPGDSLDKNKVAELPALSEPLLEVEQPELELAERWSFGLKQARKRSHLARALPPAATGGRIRCRRRAAGRLAAACGRRSRQRSAALMATRISGRPRPKCCPPRSPQPWVKSRVRRRMSRGGI